MFCVFYFMCVCVLFVIPCVGLYGLFSLCVFLLYVFECVVCAFIVGLYGLSF